MTLQLLKMHRGTATGRFIQYLCCRLIGLMVLTWDETRIAISHESFNCELKY